MKFQNLAEFSNERKISKKTLKRKYGDLIHREGRQAFIDSEKFDEIFPERSRKGKQSTRPITKSVHIKRIEFVIQQKEGKTKNLFHDIQFVSMQQKAEKNPTKISILEIDKRKKSAFAQRLQNEIQILKDRLAELIQKELNKLDEFAEPVTK